MPPRLNKRQQRELEELEALGGPSKAEVSSEEELPAPKPAKASFSNFLATEDIESESEDEGSVKAAKSRKKKKSKRKVEAKLSQTASPPLAKNEKKALKKAKTKEKKAGDDELEQALAELPVKYPELQKPSNASSSSQSFATLLSVSLPHLDSEAEMRKFFGAKVIQANKSSSSSGPSSRRHAALQRSNLTRPQPSWWSASQREGLSIRLLTGDEVTERQTEHGWESFSDKWWTIDYSQRYKSMTKSFIQAVMSGHPDALWEVQRKLPWHADNLLQLAEVYRHREEYAQAVDFVDRAIFTYERAFIGAFNFTGGTNRLDFDRVENRPFFLAVHRQIADLQRRGCVRTGFEFARLLYSLDPWEDPHGALYHLDLLAIKCGMGQWLLDLYDHFATQREQRGGILDKRMDPSLLPGFAYARALALKILEDGKPDSDHSESTAALTEALQSFPSVVPLLADKVEISLPTPIRAHRDFKIETEGRSLSAPIAALHALSHIYVQRSASLWKEPTHTAWFLATATATFASLPTTLPVTPQRQALLTLLSTNENTRYALYRHLTVLETTHARLFPFIPPLVLEQAKSLACDPLPPTTAFSRYDEPYFRGTEDMFTVRPPRSRRERLDDDRVLAGLFPDPGVRARVLELMEGFVGQIPGGVGDMMERLGPEALDDLMGQMQALVVAEQGEGMPGGFGDDGGDMAGEEGEGDVIPPGRLGQQEGGVQATHDTVDADVHEEDLESDSDEEDDSAVRRVFRNIMGRLWGPAPADETSSDEDREPIDDTGVD
ncbi:hypothetical protein DXG03_006324 [Asterophora parasitica]|uniref:DUF654-domain-containing protein n=1 Tax=Asterophora parasitica TaxID=117018 RepID=A0A9P7KB62_9AGAR|nr:hypothetical protein DXG03_006324 [Asterophora parasitica]